MLPTTGGAAAAPTTTFRIHGHERRVAGLLYRSCAALMFGTLALVLAPDHLQAATFTAEPQALPGRSAAGFQGIPWGAPPDTVEARLGEAAERDEDGCNDEFSRQALAAEGHDCVVVAMDYYLLDGIPFSASFRFDPVHRGLDAVVLTSSLKSKNLAPKQVKKVQAECRDSYGRVARRLAFEYAAVVLPHQLFEKPAAPFAKGSYQAWEGAGTLVRLRRSFDYTDHWKRWRRADGCEIEVRYAVLHPDDDALPE